jgi:hypothetical protein
MNECCREAIKQQWEEIERWKPFLHFCCEWDGLLIDFGDAEFDACGCFIKDDTGKPMIGSFGK